MRALAVFLLVIAGAAAASALASTRGDANARLPHIANVTITENAARSPAAAGTDETCAQFVLKKRDVMEFLARADEIAEHDYFHMLDWSPCYASGEIVFKNGRTATWGIHRYRGGSVKFTDGSIRYFTCPNCRAKAFLSTR